MNELQVVIEDARQLVKEKLGNDSSGHDYFHVERVVNLSLAIAKQEGVGEFDLLELIAWLHDMLDDKLFDKNAEKYLVEWLETRVPELAHQIIALIKEIGFKGGGKGQMKASHVISKIVNDADKLDAMGAIGIARCFAYGGFKGQTMYDPNVVPQSFSDEQSYRQLKTTSFNHIFEKLLKLDNYLYTNTAKEMAVERNAFLERFVEVFEKEVDNDKNANRT